VHTNKTRWEVFCENQNPNTRPINWRGIIPYIGYKQQSSCRAGIVKLQGGSYLLGDNGEISTGEQLIKLMTLAEGEQMDIYWLNGNDGNMIKAYAYIGDQYICELLPQPVYHRARAEQTEKDLTARELMSSYVATIEGYARRHRREIEKITIIEESTPVLNNKFQIRGLDHYKTTNTEEVEVLPAVDDESDFQYDLIGVETSVKPTYYDRF